MLMLQGKTPRRTWEFVPPSNRLKAMYRNDHLAAEMMHRTERQVENDVLQDVFDGHHYQELLNRDVSWKGETLSPTEKYFSQDTDVALGFATDGITPLERGVSDFWPLLLTIYNLPPEIRTQREFQICCGLIPGESLATLPKSLYCF
jgi:hypothetical protein